MIEQAGEAPEILRTDVCIVGSGPAGMSVALELGRRGVDCLLLESGGRSLGARSALSETPQVGIQTDRGNRVRALGGTSALWGGLCRRLDAADFERRSWVADSGWPIGADELAPHYETAHAILGLPPAEYDPARIDPARGSDVPLHSRDFHNAVFYYNGRPMRFGVHYAPELEASQRIRTLLDATVTELSVDPTGERVVAALASAGEGRRLRIEARRFVVACGAIQNARLLLCSDGVQRKGLGNDHGWVGRNFLQHPVWYKPRLQSFGRDQTARVRRSDRAEVMMSTALKAASAEREGLLHFHVLAIRSVPPPGLEHPRLLLRYWRRRLEEAWEEAGREPEPHEEVRDWLAELEEGLRPGSAREPEPCGLEVRPEQAPNETSRIRLGEERDALGVRRAVMDWRLGALDRESLARGTRLLARNLALAQVGRVRAGEDQLRVPEPGGAYLHGGNHHYGTTRMSGSPRRGVVDADCRVHGVKNLWIAGSSIFPTTGYANPTLTIVALAARLAQHLAKQGPRPSAWNPPREGLQPGATPTGSSARGRSRYGF